MKVSSSIIENKFLKIKTLNIGASLFEVYHKSKKINLILNLGSKENYKFKNFCVGSTCGRYAGRIGNSHDLIDLILLISSKRNKFINGSIIKADGGVKYPDWKID